MFQQLLSAHFSIVIDGKYPLGENLVINLSPVTVLSTFYSL